MAQAGLHQLVRFRPDPRRQFRCHPRLRRIVDFLLTGIRFVVGAALIILFIVDACAVIIAGFVLVVVVLGSFVRGALVFIFGQHKLVAFALGVGELRKLFFGQSIHNLYSTVAGWG
ncbi:hypothetical protein ELZ23_15830 [Brucella abortus]|nr:hypothetical protein ELZ23_15830 [Brucella abortus]